MPELNKAEIGERLRKQREKLKMSREELSEMMGITSKFLSDIEFGNRGFSLEKLLLFSEYMQLTTEYILFGIDPSINNCPEEKKEFLLSIIDKIIESYYTE